MISLQLEINGVHYQLQVPPWETLLETLRERLDLTGTKRGCEVGACGACTVLLDGAPVLSCLTLTLRCRDRVVTTVEGLSSGPSLHPLQAAAIRLGAVQCGFCTPGWLLSAKALLEENPSPSEEEVRQALGGNFCRCTGYTKIVEAVLAAAETRREKLQKTG